MYKVQTVKRFIQSFKVVGTDLFYKHIDNDACLLKNDMLIDEENHGYFIFNQYLGINHNNTTKLINLENDDIEIIPATFTGRNYYDNTFLISKDSEREGLGVYSSKYVICQLKPFKELYMLPYRYYGSGYRIKNNYLQITKERSLIQSLSLLTGEYEWEANLESYGEVRKILGVAGEKVWVVLHKSGANRNKTQLLALDVKKGDVIIVVPNELPMHAWHIDYIEETQTILSIWGKINTHQKADSPLVEISAQTGELIRNQRIESMNEANLKMGSWLFKDGKIFFKAAMEYINSTHIGVLDYETLDILWFTEVKDRKAGLKDLQVSDDKIYVLDEGHQLHIFEKTE